MIILASFAIEMIQFCSEYNGMVGSSGFERKKTLLRLLVFVRHKLPNFSLSDLIIVPIKKFNLRFDSN